MRIEESGGRGGSGAVMGCGVTRAAGRVLSVKGSQHASTLEVLAADLAQDQPCAGRRVMAIDVPVQGPSTTISGPDKGEFTGAADTDREVRVRSQ